MPYVHPLPRVPARPVADGDPVAGGAQAVVKRALAHGWTVRTLFAVGWRTRETNRAREDHEAETFIVQAGLGGEWRRLVAIWQRPFWPADGGPKWLFAMAYGWGEDRGARALDAAGIRAWLSGPDNLV